MPSTITTGGQTTWKNSYASSAQLRLTLRVNGEEPPVVFSPDASVSVAGFDAPSTATSVATGGGGVVPAGYYEYTYCYASSAYPFVDSDNTAGGETWPRSNPAESDSINVGGANEVNVTCATSQRTDIDYIFVYRTATCPSAAQAEAEANAGRFYYIGRVANDPTVASVIYVDNATSDTGEQIELDNFPCPTFRYTVFDGTYFWGWANIPLVAEVTLDGSTTVTVNDSTSWFNGRDGQTATLAGVTSGGYDQRGSFYFHKLTATTCELCTDPELNTPATIPFSGTTQLTIRGPETTLFRSKAMNPFAWGRTTEILSADRTTSTYVSDLWAEQIGGGVGTAMALIPNERLLKLDTERPARSYALDLNAADTDAFLSTLRTLDEAQSVSSHFSQFPMRLANAQSVLTGINAKALQILSADASTQVPIGDNVITTLRNLQNADNAPEFFHGVFDYTRELNCWWVKATESPWYCDTLIYQHAPTGKWGLKYSPAVSASCTVYDYETRDYFTFVGDEHGRIGIAFAEDKFSDWLYSDVSRDGEWQRPNGSAGTLTISSSLWSGDVYFNGDNTGFTAVDPNLVNGRAYILGFGSGVVRIVITDSVAGTFTWTSMIPVSSGDPSAGLYTDSVIVEDFTTMPVLSVLTASDQSGAFVTYRRYLMDEWTGISGYALNASAVFTVPDSGNYGINLDTGVYEEVDFPYTETYKVLIGATLCTARRFFTAGNPEQDKKQVEAWATVQNGYTSSTADTYLRYFREYTDSAPISAVQMVNTTADTSSMRYLARTPPSQLMPFFGVDFHNASFEQFAIADFSLKISNA